MRKLIMAAVACGGADDVAGRSAADIYHVSTQPVADDATTTHPSVVLQVTDLAKTYPLSYQGKNYALPCQWILWRIMAHDIHHGGELTALLSTLGVEMPELGDQGGHITEVPLAEAD